jgi:hypothetical protein
MACSVLVFGCLQFNAAAAQGQRPTPAELASSSLPNWVREQWSDSALQGRFVFLLRLNPFVITGDFDGDGRTDVAIAVQSRSTQKEGIVILSRTRRPTVLGAGTAFSNGGDTFTWLDGWHPGEPGSDLGPAARSRYAIYVEHFDSASAWIYWDGHRYRWRQLAD